MKKLTAIILSLVLVFSLSSAALAAEKPFENSKFYTSGDYTIHYRVFEAEGKAKGQIFLLHGFCLSSVSLEGVAAEYAKAGYRTVVADAPNFGYSSRETGDMELIDRETVLYGLIKSLGGKWIVGGHSMGGGIAINLATDHPETFTGAILFAPQTSSEVSGVAAMLMRSGVMQTMYTLVLKIALMFPSIVRSLVEMSFSDADFAASYDLSRITDPFRIADSGKGVAIMASHTRGSDLEAFSKLEIPCVILTAKDDRVANADNLRAIIDNAPEGTVVVKDLEGGHMMMEYNPVLAAELTLNVIG
ncbi:MAG: alpha/beta hydrolase [Ruminococcaceae bacterium]|nr:alpha/beta hydrolase [Oscillospiraceae bacterium]